MTAGGADAPQGPGWWLASDGRYYPPEQAPGNGSPAGQTAAPKKKIVKKKVAAKAPGPAPAGSSAARPAKKKFVKKKAVAKAPPADPTVDLTEKRSGHLKYTAKPPPSDQVAARRIQAKEQMVLLSGARQTAALRLLANLGEPTEPVLVGVGGRDLDARSHAGDSGAGTTTTSSSTATLPSAPSHLDEEAPAAPVDRDEPAPPPPPEAAAPPPPPPPPPAPPAPVEELPAEDELVDEAPVAETAVVESPAAPPPPPPPPPPPAVDPTPAADAAPVAAETERPVPHQPEVGPAPAPSPMGTDVPFMEVKGSALGTDIDRIGEKILIYANRVELRDRTNGVRQSIRYDQLAAVEVQKKMMGPSLLITSVAGATMTAKALRPELATGAKAMIEKHAARFRGEVPTPPVDDYIAPPPAPTNEAALPAAVPSAARTHRSVLSAMLDELHAAGILSPEEMEQKRALIERNDRA